MIIRQFDKDIVEGYKRIYYCVHVTMIGDDIIIKRTEYTHDYFSSYYNNRIVPVFGGFIFKTTKKEKIPINIEELLIEKVYNKLKKDIKEIKRKKIEQEKNITLSIKKIEKQLKSDSFNIITRKYKLKTLFEN